MCNYQCIVNVVSSEKVIVYNKYILYVVTFDGLVMIFPLLIYLDQYECDRVFYYLHCIRT